MPSGPIWSRLCPSWTRSWSWTPTRAIARLGSLPTPEPGSWPARTSALWKSLFVTSGELLVFVDADLVDVGSHYVTGLLGPLLTQPHVALVKAFYDRPLVTEEGVSP